MAYRRKTPIKKVNNRKRKISEVRRRRRIRFVILTVVLIGVIWLGVSVYNSDYFLVKQVKIKGNKHLSAKHITQLADIEKGERLLRVPTGKIRDKIEGESWVKDAYVRRSLPDTIEIEVQERQPVVIIDNNKNKVLIDDEYIVAGYCDRVEAYDLPAIKELPIGKLPLGKKVKSSSFDNAMKCLTSLDKTTRKSISIILATKPDKLSMYTKQGVEILYGKAEDTEKKNQVIKKILKKDGNIIFIDVRVADNPVVRRIGQTSSE